ncbi:MAG: STAS domain-containing protein [Lentisphaerae bacterium]|nr:STAS domain-containing protein [Lentisphaerota bacterium]MBT4822752.1 STAS domain-containing protein [Lentisphaerota bacterium]MBT5605829.1 STAS domain-containing protein [Lentisphaerota bacterium]MBT7061302.1 STAS domain-containing protein [Lentisphaerota bacterium]MBT7846668.1 STAS domain-containing protein [Lentisphaerota bacterium]
MNINCREETGYVSVEVSGRLDSTTSLWAEAEFTALLERGMSRILLDMSGLEYVSSAGLRVLLVVAKAVKRDDGALVLCGLNGVVSDVFEMSGFNRILEVAESREDAAAKLQQ